LTYIGLLVSRDGVECVVEFAHGMPTIVTIFDHISCARINNHIDIQDGYLESFRLRLTQYSVKQDLLGC